MIVTLREEIFKDKKMKINCLRFLKFRKSMLVKGIR